jgi:hypothetical protein
MSDKAKAKLVALWTLFTLIAAAATCGSSTAELCPQACRDVDLVYYSSTATSCNCLKDGEVVKLW